MGEERGRKIGMPVQDFTEQVYAQLAEGKEMVVVGSAVGTSHEEMRALIEKRAAVSDALNEYLLANAPGNAPASAPR